MQKYYIEKKIETFSQDFIYIIHGPVASFQWSKSSIWLLNVLGSINPQMIWASHTSSNNSNLWAFQKKFNLLYMIWIILILLIKTMFVGVIWCYERLFLKYLNLYFSERVCHSRISTFPLPLSFHNEFKTQNIFSFWEYWILMEAFHLAQSHSDHRAFFLGACISEMPL